MDNQHWCGILVYGLRTATVHAPEFEGWKKDSTLVRSRSNESKAFDPPANPVVTAIWRELDADEERIGPSTDIE